MNQLSELYIYIKTLLENDVFVNTVTKGDISHLDINKMDISPLAHILITNPNFGNSQTITFDCEVTVIDIVDENKEVNTDKFWNNNNEIDVLNETLATLNRLFSILYSDFEKKGFQAEQNGTAQQVERNKDNMIGWTLLFNVIVPNTTLNLCQ